MAPCSDSLEDVLSAVSSFSPEPPDEAPTGDVDPLEASHAKNVQLPESTEKVQEQVFVHKTELHDTNGRQHL